MIGDLHDKSFRKRVKNHDCETTIPDAQDQSSGRMDDDRVESTDQSLAMKESREARHGRDLSRPVLTIFFGSLYRYPPPPPSSPSPNKSPNSP
ncbi:hypothetical protein POX_d05642 [Penicillium oxalicum]|uniref:Uncharacterized protein n=1 Tax=Penicillium oxalicum (strain 114-2 / CGMCC 5302) TaxID=933388 RepID=S8BBE5_PENO1|nr:hypothetical protein POX_d05642 [Penicillium oxalicum]EPS32192.1 hypothetical protein PDE_07152 [Penicillium oxalicum 114-2]KAI2790137.1 hypothetical protein POX_d05642 [Penicillium oxalicum]